jgi:nitrate reductase gamma subunit
MAPIRQLHHLRRQHPSLDIEQSLQKISSVFRRFVLDTLAKLGPYAMPLVSLAAEASVLFLSHIFSSSFLFHLLLFSPLM